ncbi:PhzF family phenazine biosynthesis protein [Paludifilum halophilum]|nr:PhzF family phenazine biosynthesis protein [Paludifilum halophilum]
MHVNTFTNEPFSGNPAGVCVMAEPRDELWMSKVAQEMNLPVTAFLLKQEEGYRIRWFTPTKEIDLCGHATLASAHILWEQGLSKPDETLRFHTRSGVLTADLENGWIKMDFPAQPVQESALPTLVEQALNVPSPSVQFTGKNSAKYLVELESEDRVRNLKPDIGLLKTMPFKGDLIVTGRGTSKEYDFVSRHFAPQSGIDEDPVTGSAHCALGPYWGKRLNRTDLLAYQVSRRGGFLQVHTSGDRVYLSGRAITIMRAEWLV